jgi:hypothetical protein
MEESITPAGDKRSVGIKYGLISTVVGIVFFLILIFAGQNPYVFKYQWVFSLLTTIVLLYLAHKEYKSDNDGYMTYGEGIGIGVWFTLVAIAVGMLFNYVYTSFIDPNLMTEFYENQYEQLQQQGQSDEQIEMAQTWTKKLFWVFSIIGGTFFCMATVLIVTIFTQKKPPETRF